MRIGDPTEAILTLEREREADLVVMATHARTGLSRSLLGSVADRVARESSVPVVLLRPGVRSIEQLHTVVVPLDGTPRAAAALSLAIPLACACQASIVLVRASSASDVGAEAYLSRMSARLRRIGLPIEGRHVVGQPAAAIVAVANKLDAGLIVMNTRGRAGAIRSVLGSVADQVVRGSERPVLLVPRAPSGKHHASTSPRVLQATTSGQPVVPMLNHTVVTRCLPCVGRAGNVPAIWCQ
jgi:nucleotide-binding universal stress UspA family protein